MEHALQNLLGGRWSRVPVFSKTGQSLATRVPCVLSLSRFHEDQLIFLDACNGYAANRASREVCRAAIKRSVTLRLALHQQFMYQNSHSCKDCEALT